MQTGMQTKVKIEEKIVPISEQTNPPVRIPPTNPSRPAIDAAASPIMPKTNPKTGIELNTIEHMPKAKDAIAFPLPG